MRQDINFFQNTFHKETRLFSAAFLAQALIALAITMLLGFGYAWQRVTGLEAELQILAKQEATALERLEKLRPIIVSVTGEKSLSEQIEDALRVLGEKQTVLALVNGTTLGDTQGFSRHLRSLALQHIDGLWLTHIKLSGSGEETELRGLARRPELVPTYVQSLAGEPPFAGQRFQQFQISRPDDAVDGSVEFSMNSESFADAALAKAR